jgi:hypothetical protein
MNKCSTVELGSWNMRDILSKLLLLAVLCGCSSTAEVVGKIGPKAERFHGVATFYKNGSTAVEMSNTTGVECIGSFLYAQRETRTGNMICTDGRIARMLYTGLSRTSGYGYGIAGDGSRVVFFYGLPEEEAQKYLPPAASPR